jgi:hypothetical protein
MRVRGLLLSLALLCGVAAGQTCDLHGYKAVDGLKAAANGNGVIFTWQGESGQQLRASFGIRNSQPVVEELAAKTATGQWVVLGKDLTPEFQVTTGKRRISNAQRQTLIKYNMDTPEQEAVRKWNTFWDAPLQIPGGGDTTDLPRTESEITRGSSTYNSSSCAVATDGDQQSVTFNGLTLGIFAGDLRYTVYKGSNLLRQEAIAKTDRPSVAFIYKAGLAGFTIQNDTKVVWRDTARVWQQYQFGGEPNTNPVNPRARNRLLILDAGSGSLAVFPPPHKFFFARENEANLGYIYYWKKNGTTFSIGAMQPEKGEGYHPWGVSNPEWTRRQQTARSEWDNFALYNAPAGTEQHMAVYFYLSPQGDRATQTAVLAYTHDDVFKPLPGYKVMAGHFHLDLNEQLRDRNNMDYDPTWKAVFRGLGVNVLYLGDFHDDSHPQDPGPLRFMEEKAYFDGARRTSDKDFLVMPTEEPNAYFGGHWWLMTPKPIYLSHAEPRPTGQQFMENDPTYGTVYHVGSSEDILNMVNREQGLLWTTHPRTKSTEVWPEDYKDKDFFLSDRFIGASWESLPVDLSEKEECPVRCFGTEDDMSNWAPKAKYAIAEGDTYTKWPDDETYPQLAINYIKLDRVPLYSESWAPIISTLRSGNFFGTTGEVLFHNWSVQGSGASSVYTASIEYTFPLAFADLVWSDGTKVQHKIINLTDTLPFGTKEFKIPFDATGKKWVRFSVWDSAGDGAWANPINLKESPTS